MEENSFDAYETVWRTLVMFIKQCGGESFPSTLNSVENEAFETWVEKNRN